MEPVLDDELLGKAEGLDVKSPKQYLFTYLLYTLGYLLLNIVWSLFIQDHRTSVFIESPKLNWFVFYLLISWLLVVLYFLLILRTVIRAFFLGSMVFLGIVMILGGVVHLLWLFSDSLFYLGTIGALLISIVGFYFFNRA